MHTLFLRRPHYRGAVYLQAVAAAAVVVAVEKVSSCHPCSPVAAVADPLNRFYPQHLADQLSEKQFCTWN